MSTDIQRCGAATYVVHEPGNGTRYVALGMLVPVGVPLYGDSWLITFPLIGASYFFYPKSFTSVVYVAEKFTYQRIREEDLHEMTKCIARITGGSHDAITNDEGRFPAAPAVPDAPQS
jgi:hypothetical protein